MSRKLKVEIRPASDFDFQRIIELNAAESDKTSPMDLHRLQTLHAMACYHKVASLDGEIVGFLLVFDHLAPYDNDNHRWFLQRMSRFLYVDRIVVDQSAAGQGVGRGLYENLFAVARERQLGHVVCEYNIHPPNPVSEAFHDALGFKALGDQWVAGGTKQVRMMAADMG